MIKSLLFDQLTPVALYGEIKELYPDEITMLFESVVNTNDGNFSFIALGVKEQIKYEDNQTEYTDEDGVKHLLDEDPFQFLQEYYQFLAIMLLIISHMQMILYYSALPVRDYSR